MNAASQRTELTELLADLDEDAVLEMVRQQIVAGDDPLQIICPASSWPGRFSVR
jgi:hypothetical protein